MKNHFKITLISILVCSGLYAGDYEVRVFPNQTIGQIRDMNCTNNGPSARGGWTKKGSTSRIVKWFTAAKIPYMRPHDASLQISYGGHHTVDISGIFPDFSKNVNDPASYDFHYTDEYIGTSIRCGAKILFRLGQSIEHGSKKYGAIPPADFKKWARICEHIIRHYNEGWADGYHWNIEYWEIWNEPDIDEAGERWKTDPRCWGGSYEDFVRFYCTAAKHLKSCFPELKIGGPASAGITPWINKFVPDIAKQNAPLDFFSWHRYKTDPELMVSKSNRVDSLLKANGYINTESIVDEWNYQISFSETSPESSKMRHTEVAAAYAAAVMIRCQNETNISKMFYYDYRPGTSYHVTDAVTGNPTKCYYPLYIWGKLKELGTQVKVDTNNKNIIATAAKNENGDVGLFVCRYVGNLNEVYSQRVEVSLDGVKLSDTSALLTDSYFANTEVPVLSYDGSLILDLEPRSFAYIIFKHNNQ